MHSAKASARPVGDRLEHDRRVVVVQQRRELGLLLLDADARGDREQAHPVLDARGQAVDDLGRDVVGQALVVHALALGDLLAQVAPGEGHLAAARVGVETLDVVVVDGVWPAGERD
jgi:hypothetical protein